MSLKALLRETSLADRLLFIFLIAASLAGVFLVKGLLPVGQSVTVEVNGKPVYVLSIDKDQVVLVQGPAGPTTVEIKNRMVRIKDSPCRNRFCVKQGWVKSGSIVCLPNKVIVVIGGKGDTKQPDAITG